MKKLIAIPVLFVVIVLSGCSPPAEETEVGAPQIDQEESAETGAEPVVEQAPEEEHPEATVEESGAGETENQPALEFTAPVTAQGEVIVIGGRVLAADGNPLAGAAVEFWQTDHAGVYDHPGDPGTANRDRGFQFYGTSIADANGVYSFRTIKPGEYEPRPTHIHVKVKLDGVELLTTQFYFAEDSPTGFIGEGGEFLQMVLEQDPASGMRVANFDIVVNAGGDGSLTLTPAQGQGPYYPVVIVADYDNDLAAVEN